MRIPKRPSPALVIACLALFVSLSGVSYGVATGFIDSREIQDNTIRSKDIRNGTLRTEDIRNNEIRGFDIRNSSIQGRDVAFNTLTGADIEESSLAKVPAAANADSAAALSTLKTFAPTTLAEGGPSVTLATHGPLTLSAACIQNVGGDTVAQLRVQTSSGVASAGGNLNADTIQPSDGPVTIGQAVDTTGGAATVAAVPVFATAGAQGMSGTVGLYAVSVGASDSCRVSGHVVLEG
jgi:hypothetical protein